MELERLRDRRKRRSRRRHKAVVRCARLKAKNARRRLDFHHQESARLITRFSLIGSEKLQISNLTRSAKGSVDKPGKNVKQKAGLNREILDTAPARFLKFVSYRSWCDLSGSADPQAETVPEVPSLRRYPEKTLGERIHQCGECGHTEPRDAASARVCLIWALKQIDSREPADAA